MIIEVKGVTKWHPGGSAPALDGVDLRIPRGEIYGLLGANGAGKSTLLHILMGLLPKDGGRVQVDGIDLDADAAGVRSRFGFVPQTPALYPTLTTAENLGLFAAARGLRGAGRRREVARVVAIADLGKWLGKRAASLSGGVQRRLNLAVGLLGAPPILCLDEPTVGVDLQSRQSILEAVAALAADGTTVLYTSHYMEEVEHLCRRIALLEQGRIVADGTLETLQQLHPPTLTVTFTAPLRGDQATELCAQLGGSSRSTTTLELPGDASAVQLERLGRLLRRHDLHLQALRYGHYDLQQLFFHLTGRSGKE